MGPRLPPRRIPIPPGDPQVAAMVGEPGSRRTLQANPEDCAKA
jgi:hypothetical protein